MKDPAFPVSSPDKKPLEERLQTTFLSEPSIKYRDSYIAALREFQAAGNYSYSDEEVERMARDFPGWVQTLKENITDSKFGNVSETHLWLIDQDRYIGRVNVRHELSKDPRLGGHIGYSIRPSEREKGYGTKSLELGLMEAKRLGLKKVLLVCETTNTASRAIIEKNGGVLEGQVVNPETGADELRYWINLQ